MKYTVELINQFDDFHSLKTIWNDLLSQSPTDTYFMRWEWISNWWDVYSQSSDELTLLVIKDDKTIICIAPFYIRKRRIANLFTSNLLMLIGTQYHGAGDACSDYLDFIYLKDYEQEHVLINIIIEYINNQVNFDEIYLSKINTASVSMQLFIEKMKANGLLTTTREEYISPYIELPDSWQGYMDGITASMRYKIRREQRKLEKNFNVSFRTSNSLEELEKDYLELIRMHTDWWHSRGIEGAFSNPEFKRFHEKVMPIMLNNNHLDLHFMHDDNKNLAVLYLINYNKKVYFYQSGIENNSKKCAFGYIIHSYCINYAIKAGFTKYDFLPDINTNSYKQKYTKQNIKIADIYFCRNNIIKAYITLTKGARIIYKPLKKVRRFKRTE